MNERPETHAGPVVKVAQHLTEIENLYQDLTAQAIHKANDRLMPGGEAMVALGHVASPDDWAEGVAYAELRHVATCDRLDHTRCRVVDIEHEDNQEPPLQTLLFWSEAWRKDLGYPLEGRVPTMRTEANFLREVLNWAWDNVIEWDDFARDVRQARTRLENILYAGERQERSRVVCDRCEEDPPRLLVFRGAAEDGGDLWKCPRCKRHLTVDEVSHAHAAMLRSDGAERWVHHADAVSILKAQGRPERTVRQWLSDGLGESYCDPKTGQVYAWWPALWTKHLATATRKRATAMTSNEGRRSAAEVSDKWGVEVVELSPIGKHGHLRYFVLDPACDPAARIALQAYREATPDRDLRKEITKWLDDLGSR